jgi:hypothetical protein
MSDTGRDRSQRGETRRGARKIARKVDPRGYEKQPLAERLREEPDVPPVPPGRDRERGEQSSPTQPEEREEPGGERHPVDFTSYTPLDPTQLVNVKIPVDPCGCAAENGVVAMTGNVYLAVSTDDGGSFKYFDPRTMFSAFAGGLLGDQQIIYVPRIDQFVWCMLHGPVGTTGDGAFRLAFASPEDVMANPSTAWAPIEFLASDIGVAGADFDQPHLTYTNQYLIIAVDVTAQGRVVVRIPLTDIPTGSIGWDFTDPLTLADSSYQYSAPCGSQPNGVYMAGHIDTSTMRVFALPDGGTNYGFHDVGVSKWSDSADYSSKTPSGVDWCGRCKSRVSGATARGTELWFSWMAPRSIDGETPFYPEPHTRVVAIDRSSFNNISEMQVWNPEYSFGYSTLAVNSDNEVAIAVGWGGPSDEADTAFGIIGDFVVWYRDGSTATVDDPSGSANGRWGDFLRTHRSNRASSQWDGFGYFTVTDAGGNLLQNPFHLRYGRS